MTEQGSSQSDIDTMELPAAMSNWDVLIGFVQKQVDQSLNGSEKSYGVLLSAEELLSNIIRVAEACPDPSARQVSIRVSASNVTSGDQPYFLLQISDNGDQFDPCFDDISDHIPDTPVDNRAIGGLGLYLVKTSVDKVTYTHEKGYNVYAITTYLS